jgi:CRISPR system Cascade subunit CasD
MNVLLVRLDEPLLSFGGTVVDAKNVTDDMPSRSMVTGLLGNALGYDHRDFDLLDRLQSRLRLAARRDRAGERLVDFQTVDLGQGFLEAGWTTWGVKEGREGGTAGEGTHIRYRHYLADAVYTLAVAIDEAHESPTLHEVAAALDTPARPLFLGRKACLPSAPLKLGLVEAGSLLEALRDAPVSSRRGRRGATKCLVRVPRGTALPEGAAFAERAVTEERDWPNQIHVGRSIVLEGFVECGTVSQGEAR